MAFGVATSSHLGRSCVVEFLPLISYSLPWENDLEDFFLKK
jgi:hypothetical protein